jgi:hypothetical protein
MLEDLHWRLASLERARTERSVDKTEFANQRDQVYSTMRRVSEIHPDPVVRYEYRIKAEEIKKSKGGAMRNIGVGLGVIILSPFALAGAALLLSGGIIAASGEAIVHIGHALTAGQLKKYSWIPGGKKKSSSVVQTITMPYPGPPPPAHFIPTNTV